MDGLTLQSWLAKLEVALPVIVITGQGDVQTAVRAMKGSAVDFIEKPYNDESLLNAIETALARAGRPDRAHEAGEAKQRIAELTPRERQVLDALVAGHPNRVRSRHQHADGQDRRSRCAGGRRAGHRPYALRGLATEQIPGAISANPRMGQAR